MVGAFVDDVLSEDAINRTFVNGVAANANNVTNTLKLHGDLRIEEDGQVLLGGQPQSNVYTGLIADNVTVAANASGTSIKPNLQLTRAHIGTLTVEKGYVTMHEKQYAGNSYLGNETGGMSMGGVKQVVITTGLNVSGGTVVIGNDNTKYLNSYGHYVTALGDAAEPWGATSAMRDGIKQSGGSLTLKGKTIAQSGLNVLQTAGTMKLASTSKLQIQGSNANTFTQNSSDEDAKMSIGLITGSNTVLHVRQENKGTIEFLKGIEYKNTSKASSLTQLGGGKINLSGNFTSATFDVNQTDGTINLTANAKLKGGVVKIGDAMNIGAGASLSAKELYMSDKSAVTNAGTMVVGTGTASGSASDTLYVTTGGKLQLSGTYGSAADTDAVKKVSMTGGDMHYAGEVTLDSATISGGTFHLDDGGNQLTIGTLSVTGASSFTMVLNSAEAQPSVPITVGNSWTMGSDTTFGLSFTDAYVKSASWTLDATTGMYTANVNELVASGTAVTLPGLQNKFTLLDLDSELWALEDAAWTQSTTGDKTYVNGKLVYNPWKEVDGGGEVDTVFIDPGDGALPHGIRVSKQSVTLSGDNSHSLGTKVAGGATEAERVKLTLGHENALGSGTLETSGYCELATEEGVAANLTAPITNSGNLIMSGDYSYATRTGLSRTTLPAAYISNKGEEGNGFYRARGYAYQVVNLDGTAASLTVGNGTIVSVGGIDYELREDGKACMPLDYSTYHLLQNNHKASVSEIQAASGGVTEDVELNAGTLIADQDVKLAEATGGELITKTGARVTGTINENTTISAEGGEIAANIGGDTTTLTVMGAVTVSGENTSKGGTTVAGGNLMLASSSALGAGNVKASGDATISAEAGRIATLGATISNQDNLTLNGKFDASGIAATVIEETFINTANTSGADGFKRESGSWLQLVNHATEASTLTLGADFLVLHNGVAYEVDRETGVAQIGGEKILSSYYLNSDTATADMSKILNDAGTALQEVLVKNGTLTVDADAENVQATGGKVQTTGDVCLDGNLYGKTQLAVENGTATLKGDNSHTGGTAVNGASAVLADVNALGAGAVVTTGSSFIDSDVDGALLSSPIQNSGDLTLSGAFDASGLHVTAIDETRVDVDGKTGENGFIRNEGSSLQVVENDAAASLTLGTDFELSIGTIDYALDTDTGVATAGAGVNYDTYLVGDDDHAVTLERIQTEASGQTSKVFMSAGELTLNAGDMEVETTGGTLITESGKISGSIADTEVEADGGTIAATICGDSSVVVTDDTTISGANSYSGGTTVADAKVTLDNAAALGTGDVTTSGTSTLTSADGTEAGIGGTLTVESGSLTLDGDFVLSSAIVNKGSLTLDGAIKADALAVDVVGSTLMDTTGTANDKNGFARNEGSSIDLVENAGSVTLGDNLSVTHGSVAYQLDAASGIAYAHGTTEYGTYYIGGEDHKVKLSLIQTASNNATTKVEMSTGSLTADGGAIEVASTGGELIATAGKVSGSIADTSVSAQGGEIEATITNGSLSTCGSALVSGKVTDADIKAAGGTISGEISGASSVTVTGETTLSGSNSYSGDTLVKGEAAKLVLASGSNLGSGRVQLDDHGTLDLGGNAISNDISVTGCTLAGAGAYTGSLDVTGDLKLQDATTAAAVVIRDNGRISGARLTTSAVTVGTTGNAEVAGDLTINDNGTITLNNGKVLMVGGSLTLGNGTTLLVDSDYSVGDTLVTSKTGTITMGSVNLDYNDPTVELELQGGSLVLVSLFKQPLADAQVLANWGTFTASRSFVNAVRDQRTNTGCIANGRGTAWAAVLGGTHEIGSGDINLKGTAVGADVQVGRRTSVGVAFGYIEGDVESGGLSKVEQEGTYVALYGEHGLKKLSDSACLSLDWVATYGDTESEQGRRDWEQQSLQLNTRLNWNKKVTERLCVSVFGGLEYYTNESDRMGGIKTGSLQNLRGELGVGARYVAWDAPAAAGKIARPGCEKLVFYGELRYMNDMVRNNPTVEINGLRGGADNPGRYGMGIEAGATYRIGERWSSSVNYGFNTMDDSREHRVNVGASYSF